MTKVKILVAGNETALGKALIKFLGQIDIFEIYPLFVQDADQNDAQSFYSDGKSVRKNIISLSPDYIINCAEINDLSYCEEEKNSARNTNVVLAENLIKAGKICNAHCILLSSAHVFDGKKQYYSEEDKPNPQNYFGKTKLEMENLCKSSQVKYTIIRIGEIFGLGSACRLDDMTASLIKGRLYKADYDLVQSITYAGDLFLSVYRIIEKRREGIYHVASPRAMSMADIADFLDDFYIINRTNLIMERNRLLTVPEKCVLITLKAETELSFRMTGYEDGLQAFMNSKIIVPNNQ